MNIIIGERRSGKTTTLLELASKNPDTYLVVRDKKTATEVFHKAIYENWNINFPLTYDELLEGRGVYGMGMEYSILIDDLDSFVRHVCGHVPIEGFSLSIDFKNDDVIALNKQKPVKY